MTLPGVKSVKWEDDTAVITCEQGKSTPEQMAEKVDAVGFKGSVVN